VTDDETGDILGEKKNGVLSSGRPGGMSSGPSGSTHFCKDEANRKNGEPTFSKGRIKDRSYMGGEVSYFIELGTGT
jgi:hypothetical protein